MHIKPSATKYSMSYENLTKIRAVIIGITILFIILMGVVSATASGSNDDPFGATLFTLNGAEIGAVDYNGELEIEPSVKIVPSTQTVLIGEPFAIDVMVDPVGLSTAGLQFNLNYDRSVVTVNSVTERDFLNQNGASTLFNPGTIDNIGGSLTDVYGVIFGRVSVSTSGTFVTISMTANLPGFSTLDLSNVIVSNSFGSSIPVLINNGSVSVSEELLAEAAGPSIGAVNAPVSFTGSATGGTGVYAIWHWEFGDGGFSDEQNPSYSYTTAGTYTVNLTVTDTAGNNAEITLNCNVVNPTGGIAITSTPKPLMMTSGTSGVMNVKLVSSANFDDIVEVTLDTSGFPDAYAADLSWFNSTSVMVQVPAGQTVLVPFDVSIPPGVGGYKVFKDSARSLGLDATSMDTGVVYVT